MSWLQSSISLSRKMSDVPDRLEAMKGDIKPIVWQCVNGSGTRSWITPGKDEAVRIGWKMYGETQGSVEGQVVYTEPCKTWCESAS